MTYTQHTEGTLPRNGEIFVFGSNLAGRHGAGAAKIAISCYGAIYGQGIGLHGSSYALPTKDANFNVLSLDRIREYVDQFIEFANECSNTIFFVTGVGCGYAGYTASEIAPLFVNAGPNVSLPDIFVNVLTGENE